MDEEYDYIKSKNVEELVKIIDDFNDMDATTEAMLELWDRDEEIALEMGIKLLKGNEGDEYFQATIFDIIYDLDFDKVLECISNRNHNIGGYLLKEIIKKMTDYSKYKFVPKVDFIPKYVDYIVKQHDQLDSIEKQKVAECYNEFVNEFKVMNE